MYFKQFLHDETGCASYLIASRESRQAAVIDPQYAIQPYLDLATEREYQIVLVIDTTPSMGYRSNDQTRLDLAKKRALEFLETGSRATDDTGRSRGRRNNRTFPRLLSSPAATRSATAIAALVPRIGSAI